MKAMVSFSAFTFNSSRSTSVTRFTARRFCSMVRPASIVICTCAMGTSVGILFTTAARRGEKLALSYSLCRRGETFVRLRPFLALAQYGKASLLRQFVSGEEITQLEARRVFGVGAVHRVLLDARSPLLANRTRVGLGRIGGAHQRAIVGNGVLFLQRHHDNRPARHEVGQRLEEWPVHVHRVEAFGLRLGDVQQPHANDAKVVLQQGVNDVARRAFFKRVGLDDGKSALDGFHEFGVALFSWLFALGSQLLLVAAKETSFSAVEAPGFSPAKWAPPPQMALATARTASATRAKAHF